MNRLPTSVVSSFSTRLSTKRPLTEHLLLSIWRHATSFPELRSTRELSHSSAASTSPPRKVWYICLLMLSVDNYFLRCWSWINALTYHCLHCTNLEPTTIFWQFITLRKVETQFESLLWEFVCPFCEANCHNIISCRLYFSNWKFLFFLYYSVVPMFLRTIFMKLHAQRLWPVLTLTL